MKYLSFCLIALMLFNCKSEEKKLIDADEVIQKAINASGVKKLDNAVLSFDFRDKHYIAARTQGKFQLQRQFKQGDSLIHDYLGNKGFERYINDSLVAVADSMATKYSASVNSVHYFAVLPSGLDGKAVNKIYLGEATIMDKNYYKIQVTFDENGGGEDFEDVFIYWVNQKTFNIDYLAYSYNEDDGKGLRFREAYNERYIDGVRFVDYNNYKPTTDNTRLENLDDLFQKNQLELLSKIELKNVSFN
ncbi:deoxyribose-phosphate aldolase [Subsaxibacter sp. CAU 1640]|uniref:DUF6503 family protein n=1 Tax=Subsaxibacter sp. CAU 1640 TaxID=2933271 RepID=UPI0020055A88|nr:DUF6503 family protein [Subsaxibacter sp. CAU 1640]MCK7591227.1 deoxyribose-phosphate aldolase [Subsaxibacter sp. CAU 1640]